MVLKGEKLATLLTYSRRGIEQDSASVAGVSVLDKFLGSTADFLSELRRERAVELSFEGFRFIDLRRWMLLTQYPYTLKTKIEFYWADPSDYNYDQLEENAIKKLAVK